MQPNRKFLGVKLTSLLSLLVLLSLSGCSGCGRGPSKKKDLIKDPLVENPKAILLFHGINDKGNLKNLADKLAKDFPDAKVVALDRDNSASAPITQQAQEAFEALKKQDLLGRDLVLFGNSQGGLLAFSLYDQYQTQLHVKGIITDCTPWEGAPVANLTDSDIDNLAAKLALKLGIPSSMIEPYLKKAFADFTQGTGAADLKPNSPFLKEVAKKLPNAQIPILALAGTQVSLSHVFAAILGQPALAQTNLDGIKAIWGAAINNNIEPYDAHDFIVPLYSAKAEKICPNNNKLASFQAKGFKGYHHFMGMDQVPLIYNIVVETIKQYFVQTDADKI